MSILAITDIENSIFLQVNEKKPFIPNDINFNNVSIIKMKEQIQFKSFTNKKNLFEPSSLNKVRITIFPIFTVLMN